MNLTSQGFQVSSTPSPTLVVLDEGALFIGPPLDLSPHRIPLTTLAIGLRQPFDLASPPSSPDIRQRLAIIPAGTLHRLRASGDMAFVYTGHASFSDPAGMPAADLAALAGRIGDRLLPASDALAAARELMVALGIPRWVSPETPLEQAIFEIAHRPWDTPRAEIAASLAGLQTQRFRRRLQRETGLSFRQHLMRGRIAATITSLADGASLTEAAHAAGFSSSAHLSSTFRRMFGIAPSTLLKLKTRFITASEADRFR